jgi:hypothetical protein
MMASEDLKTQAPVEENGTKEEEKNGNLEASTSNENGDSSDVSSVIQKEDEEGEEEETKGDCFCYWVVLKLLNLSFFGCVLLLDYA